MVLGKAVGISFATAEAARQTLKVYIKTQALGELDNFASETVMLPGRRVTSGRRLVGWGSDNPSMGRCCGFFDESSSPQYQGQIGLSDRWLFTMPDGTNRLLPGESPAVGSAA